MQALVIQIDTPPGLSWKQRQVARLEALHRSPMPVDRVEVLLKRRSPWKIGSEASFHAALVRRDAITTPDMIIDLEVDGEIIRFEVDQFAGLRRLAPIMGLSALGSVAAIVAISSGWSAGQIRPRSAPAPVSRASARSVIAGRNAALIGDLIAVREAFGGGQGIQSVEWRPEGLVVEAPRSDASTATGDGRAFEKLPRVDGGSTDRWRLAPARPRGARP